MHRFPMPIGVAMRIVGNENEECNAIKETALHSTRNGSYAHTERFTLEVLTWKVYAPTVQVSPPPKSF